MKSEAGDRADYPNPIGEKKTRNSASLIISTVHLKTILQALHRETSVLSDTSESVSAQLC